MTFASCDLAKLLRTIVAVAIEPDEDGCEVALTHEGVSAEYADRTAAGWATILGRLAEGLATPGRRP